MQFNHSQPPISIVEIDRIERDLEIRLPEPVRKCYVVSNGGVPSRYVFTNNDVDTVVSELLPLKSTTIGTAVDCYSRLVLALKMVPRHMFPFAIDGGGDYFFVDCSTLEGRVLLFRGDTAEHDSLIDLNMGFATFWESLRVE